MFAGWFDHGKAAVLEQEREEMTGPKHYVSSYGFSRLTVQELVDIMAILGLKPKAGKNEKWECSMKLDTFMNAIEQGTMTINKVSSGSSSSTDNPGSEQMTLEKLYQHQAQQFEQVMKAIKETKQLAKVKTYIYSDDDDDQNEDKQSDDDDDSSDDQSEDNDDDQNEDKQSKGDDDDNSSDDHNEGNDDQNKDKQSKGNDDQNEDKGNHEYEISFDCTPKLSKQQPGVSVKVNEQDSVSDVKEKIVKAIHEKFGDKPRKEPITASSFNIVANGKKLEGYRRFMELGATTTQSMSHVCVLSGLAGGMGKRARLVVDDSDMTAKAGDNEHVHECFGIKIQGFKHFVIGLSDDRLEEFVKIVKTYASVPDKIPEHAVGLIEPFAVLEAWILKTTLNKTTNQQSQLNSIVDPSSTIELTPAQLYS